MYRYQVSFLIIVTLCSFSPVLSSESSQSTSTNTIMPVPPSGMCSGCQRQYSYRAYHYVALRSTKNLQKSRKNLGKEPASATCVNCGTSIAMKWVAKQKPSDT